MKIVAIHRVVLFTLLIAFIAGCDSQGDMQEPVPEPPPALRYFPLEVGNVWEYERFGQTGDDFCPNDWTLSGYLRYEIEDEVIVQGKRYFQLAGTQFDLEGSSFNPYVLTIGYDTTAVQMINLDPEGHERIWFESPCEPYLTREGYRLLVEEKDT